MILPCRIHRACRLIGSLRLAFLFAAFLLIPYKEVMGQNGWGHVPLEITTGVDFGYDDHVIGSNAAAGSSSPTSFFSKESLVLTYDRPKEQKQVSVLAVGRFT